MKKHRILSLIVALIMSTLLLIPAFAAAEPAEDVVAGDAAVVEVAEDEAGAAEAAVDPATAQAAALAQAQAEEDAATARARTRHLIVGAVLVVVCGGVYVYATKRKR